MKQQQTEDAEDRRKRSTKKRGTDRKAKRRVCIIRDTRDQIETDAD
jgi:hypothetical protein